MTKDIEMKNSNILLKIADNEDLSRYYEEEGNLSPPMYESDEDLRKVGTNEHDYLIKIGDSRKIILGQQLGKWNKNVNKKESSAIADKNNKILLDEAKVENEESKF